MSGIGWTEFLVIALILLIFVGPQRLPEVFGKLSWMIAQLRSASRDLRSQFEEGMSEIREIKSDITDEMKARTDRMYAEVRSVDDEYKAIQDSVNDSAAELKKDIQETAEQPGAEKETKEMKG